MKKLLFYFLLLLSAKVIAQPIPNNGFENWSQQGPFLTPNSWAISPGVKQAMNAHSGSYALTCSIDTFTNPQTSTLDTIAGMAYSGAQTMGPPQPGTNLSGYAFAFRPDSLTGWATYMTQYYDSFSIAVTLSKWNSTSGMRETIGFGEWVSNAVIGNYTRFALPINYMNNTVPDSALIQIQILGGPGAKHIGTTLTVDDLLFVTVTLPNAIATLENTTTTLELMPNPATTALMVKTTAVFDHFEISNLVGQVVMQTNVTAFSIAALPNGMYTLSAIKKDGTRFNKQFIKAN